MSPERERTGAEREAALREREAARLEREREAARRPEPLALSQPPLTAEPELPAPEPDGDEPLDEPFDELEDEPEAPAGTRRVAGVPGRRSGRPARPVRRPHRPAGGRARHSLVGRVFSLVALVLGAALIWFLVELFQPFHGAGHGSITVTIPAHASSSTIGDQLERDGVISSSFFFELRATLAGERGELRSGRYRLKLDMSYGAVLSALTTPPKAAKVTELTITPGRTRRQISALLSAQGVPGNYFDVTHRSRLLNPAHYGAPRDINSLEGFLSPDTYQLVEPVSITALIADQLSEFRHNFAGVKFGYARSRHLTPYDVLIIASMIEAEAQTARDRPLVGSVIYNRLRDGMPLQIDATTRYASGNYTSPLTVSELNSSSPYNTRIHKGLTPTPIGNPGMASIEAAAHPANTNYLYFVVKPCGNGEQVFTSSYTQFLADAQAYQAARSRRGGKSPARC